MKSDQMGAAKRGKKEEHGPESRRTEESDGMMKEGETEEEGGGGREEGKKKVEQVWEADLGRKKKNLVISRLWPSLAYKSDIPQLMNGQKIACHIESRSSMNA